MKPLRITLFLFCLFFSFSLCAQETAFRKHIDYLTSDQLKGRLAGSAEDSLAAGYIRQALQSYGYQPLYDNGWQHFPIIKRKATQATRDTSWSLNVAMWFEGSDPALKNEYVVLGAHYDHLGLGGKSSGSRRPDTIAIHRGADDNASGVAMLLETARQLASNNPKRSVAVVAFGAEEQGVVGSKYFVKNLPPQKTKPALMVNYDMVGRLNSEKKIEINGTGTFIGAQTIIQSAPNPDSLHFTLIPGGFGPSDHTPFYADSIPVLFFTTGVHYDYHTPADNMDNINYTGMEQVYNYTYQLLQTLVNNPDTPIYQKAGNETSMQAPAFKVTLGLIPDFNNVYEGDGMRADFVTAGKPADKAGMKNNDIILQIDGKPVHTIEDYMKRLSELTAGRTVIVKVLRGDETLELLINL